MAPTISGPAAPLGRDSSLITAEALLTGLAAFDGFATGRGASGVVTKLLIVPSLAPAHMTSVALIAVPTVVIIVSVSVGARHPMCRRSHDPKPRLTAEAA